MEGTGQVVNGTAIDLAGNTSSTSVSVNIRFDDDSDGVFNSDDQCPDTPANEIVDVDGCSASQLDADADGIVDAFDACPNTPSGELVDSTGCSISQLDTDGDGVTDAADLCPSTPTGEVVDATGCSLSQLDLDGDGVSDAADQCPGTPLGESVDAQGCSASQLDGDADGVFDNADLCANTPAGEVVDTNGCSASQLDEDGDGVTDTADLCPSTPTGEAIDTTGCSLSQLDTDGDGVSDAVDQCPGTPAGEAIDTAGCSTSQGGGPLPPDPTTVAPSVDRTGITTMFDATEFLFTGTNPIQTGVATGTIDPLRVAVMRGQIFDTAGNALSGVTISVLDNSEFGQTRSRQDGMFDIAVNGGGVLTIVYRKSGYLEVHRQLEIGWQTYGWLPDVVMTAPDNTVTSIDLASSVPIQVARGSLVTDQDGTRQATMMFTQGTQVDMVFPNGSTQPLSSTMNVRATEYTVGDTGPQAMPGELPPTSGYTYAVELSVDEASAAGASEVHFSKPVNIYLENFIGIPVGMSVPSGYYDRQKGLWIPSDDGLTIKVLSVAGGLAAIDVDGSGIAASATVLSNLGVSAEEQQQLAQLYAEGDELWRVPVTHFTPWDYNYPYGPPQGAESPQAPGAESQDDGDQQNKPSTDCNSIVDCENQVLGESIDIVGSPFSLNYSSQRVPGRNGGFTLLVPVTDSTLPLGLKSVELEIIVAGRRFADSLAALPDQTYTFTWDGLDAYERTLYGSQAATVRIGYVYDAQYYATSNASRRSFGAFGTTPITGVRSRNELTIWQEIETRLGSFDARQVGLGGWTLDAHHSYDPASKTLYFGDGTQRAADRLPNIVRTIAGDGTDGTGGIGGPGNAAQIGFPQAIEAAPDGSVYIAENINHRILKVDADGIISVVAGNGTPGFSGDGGPATSAQLDSPTDIAIGNDGSVYIADTLNNRIRRLAPDGKIFTFAGSGPTGFQGSNFAGDGGPATSALLSSPGALDIGSDGVLYLSDLSNGRIRRITTDSIIETVRDERALNLAVGRDGSLFYSTENFGHRIKQLTPRNRLLTVLNQSGSTGSTGDGGPALFARTNRPDGFTINRDGSLLLAETNSAKIREISPDGIINTFAGTGNVTGAFNGDFRAATQTNLRGVRDVSIAANGTVYVADTLNRRVRAIGPMLPGLGVSEIAIASENGDEMYIFTEEGKHLRTLDALTGSNQLDFAYDVQGYLISITDVGGNTHTIQRMVDGTPTSITSPDGLSTGLSLDANGFLANISNPVGESYSALYSPGGLMTDFTDPRNGFSFMTYHTDGRLDRDTNPAGGFLELIQSRNATGFSVNKTTSEGRVTNYVVDYLSTGENFRRTTNADATVDDLLVAVDGSKQLARADGTVTSITLDPDPRFGMQAPVIGNETTTSPGGLASVTTVARTAVLDNPADLFSINTLTDTITINGDVYTSTYTGASKTLVETTPEGRVSSKIFDNAGRVIQLTDSGLNSVTMSYDSRGRLAGTTQGSGVDARLTSYTYDVNGFIDSVTDQLNQTISYEYNNAGRRTRIVFDDGSDAEYTYDQNGNTSSITTPGGTLHQFLYTPVNLLTEYDPPNAFGGNDKTIYNYNLDKQLDLIVRPDASSLDYVYNSKGQLTTLSIPRGIYSYTYDTQSGNLSGVTAPGGDSLVYTYDGSLPLSEQWSGTVTGFFTRSYNNDFQVVTENVNGNSLVLIYDNDGLLTQIGALSLSRDPQSGLITATSLEDLATATQYNGFGESLMFDTTYNGSSLYDAAYTRDKLGRITDISETVGGLSTGKSYSYDAKGRLIGTLIDGTTLTTYTYDNNGNRTSAITSLGTLSASYDSQDRLTTYGNFSYTYTTNGELQSRTNTLNSETTGYIYDVLGNLTNVQLPDGKNIDYVIDGQNRRIGKRVDGTLIQGLLYKDSNNPIAELDGSNDLIARFVYGERTNTPDYMIKNGNTYRFVNDHLGSPRLIIDISDGSITQRMDYDAFGNVTLDTNPGFQPFGFAGGLYDTDTGLVRFGARDYDPFVGRWTSKDPILFDGEDTNLYGYAFNDPINLIDPLGNEAVENVNKIIDGVVNYKNRYDESFRNVPPEGSGPLSKNPATGNPYIVDEFYRSRKDLRDTQKDLVNTAEGAAGLVGDAAKKGAAKKIREKIEELLGKKPPCPRKK